MICNQITSSLYAIWVVNGITNETTEGIGMYIFGYGSLINAASRALTGQTGKAIPATIHGFIRHWSMIDESYRLAPLAVNHGDGQVNGVLLEIDEHELKHFDAREAGYHRTEVDPSLVECATLFDPSRPIWLYITDKAIAPTHQAPIVQSYVDTVLAGCLEISQQFANHFLTHTQGWQHAWENDRLQPKYPRGANIARDQQEQIDRLLKLRC